MTRGVLWATSWQFLVAYNRLFEPICKHFVTPVIGAFSDMQQNHGFNFDHYPCVIYCCKIYHTCLFFFFFFCLLTVSLSLEHTRFVEAFGAFRCAWCAGVWLGLGPGCKRKVLCFSAVFWSCGSFRGLQLNCCSAFILWFSISGHSRMMDLPPLMPQLLRKRRGEEFFPGTGCFAESSWLVLLGSFNRADGSIGAAEGACQHTS